MSKLINKPIIIPSNINFEKKDKDNLFIVSGLLGSLKKIYNKNILTIEKLDNNLFIKKNINFKVKNYKLIFINSYVGTIISIIKNMIFGVTNGFKKNIKLFGIGYKVEFIESDNILLFNLGYSHKVLYKVNNLVNVYLISDTEILLKSIDKQLLGKISSEIRDLKKPEPYKGKGIRYLNENIKLKSSKKK